MRFCEFLKSKRNIAGLTREQAATRIGVEPRTVANWESGVGMPSSVYWRNIIDVYNLADEDFRDRFFEEACPSSIFEVDGHSDNIPGVLFTDTGLEAVRKLIFTPVETEMLKNLAIYAPDWFSDSFSGNPAESVYAKLPYAYASRFDIAEFRLLLDLISKRLDYDKDILKMVEDWILRCKWLMTDYGYTDPVSEFDVRKLPLEYIIDMAESMHRWNSFTHPVYRMLAEIKKGNDNVFRKNTDIDGYLIKTRPQYYDLRTCFEHEYDDGSSDEAVWSDLLRWHEVETGGIVNYECGDKKFSGIIEHRSGTHVRTESMWEYGVLVNNHDLPAPAEDWIRFEYEKDEDGIIMSCGASLTEKGEHAWQYSLEHPELF